ncbi:MAG: ABC transporter permease [Defluviitaleaceae bacterium]|nr:ABC transporter permease [Defluviitaleaceae bacterium]
MKQLFTVMKFEYLTFVKSKFFIIVTIVMVLTGLILPSVPTIGGALGGGLIGSEEGSRLGFYDATGMFGYGTFIENLPEYEIIEYSSVDEIKKAVESGGCDFAVGIEDGYSYAFYVQAMKISYYNVMGQIDSMIRNGYRISKFAEAGLDESLASEIIDFAPQSRVESVSVPGSDSAESYQENVVYAYAMIFLLYFGLLMFGQYILTSVVREKTTKTMELLITSCKSSKLIHGKVMGVGLANLTQLALLGVAAVGSIMLNASINEGAEGIFVVSIKPEILACMFAYFLLGFLAYGYVYAALGSTVSRMEDANNAAGLPMMFIIFGFIGAMAGLLTPGATWVTALSYVPLLTPMVMFMRFCMGAASGWEAALGILLQIVTIAAVGWLGGHIYRMGTLMYGKKLKPADLLRAIKG